MTIPKTNFFKNKQIKNIIFDFDETIIHTRPHISNYIHGYLAQHGIILDKEQAMAAGRWYHKFWDGDINHLQNTFDPEQFDSVSFWLNYLRQYYDILGSPQNSLQDVFTQLAHEIEERPVEKIVPLETVESLKALKAAGFRMGVLSNRYLSVAPAVEANALNEYFPHAFSAGELGAAKPDSAIFIKFLEKFGGKAEESIYVGDNYWLDVKGASRAGLQPVLLDIHGWYTDPPCPVIQDLSQLIPLLTTE